MLMGLYFHLLIQKVKKHRYILGGMIVAAAGGLFLSSTGLPYTIHRLADKNNFQPPITVASSAAQAVESKPAKLVDLEDEAVYDGLPVDKVAAHPVRDAKGTAIFLPQIHRSPGTEVRDPRNDQAEASQAELYSVLSFLLENAPVGFVMTEGELAGPVDEKDEVDAIRQSLERLARISPKNETLIEKIERKIMVEGAPYILKAQGRQFTLLGSENPDTYEESSRIMREYIFQKERYRELAGMKRMINGRGTGFVDTPAAESHPSGLYDGNNPYARMTDIRKLSALLEESEEKVEMTIMEKRNRETAENFAKAIDQYDARIGVIQYGAAHEDGLVEELNNQGFSVIVITTPEILK